MPKTFNYNTDLIKHYVRYYGWVKPFKTILNAIDTDYKKGNRPERCKYLTFCAAQAVDVFLFEHLNYLYRNDDTKRLENVYFCENDEESFSIIQKLIGSAEQGFFGDFKEIILQNENVIPTNASDPFDEPERAEDREKLRLISLKKQLIDTFPFDVINLDFYGNFFPSSESRYSDSFQTYQQVLELQKTNNGYDCKRFLMYLTVYTPITNEKRFVKPEVMTSFDKILLENLVYTEFEQAIEGRYGHRNTKNLEVYVRFILGFTKQVLFKETYRLGWEPEIQNILTYDRVHSDGTPHKETTFIIEYKRNSRLDGFKDFTGNVFGEIEGNYKKQLFSIVSEKPEHVPSEDKVPKAVKDSLKEVIAFRNKFLKEIGIYTPNVFD